MGHFCFFILECHPNDVLSLSVTMDFDLVLDCDSFFDKESLDVFPMVTLELDDCAPLFVLNCCSVAAPGLLEGSFDFFAVQIIREPLHQCKAFPCVSLLEPEMDKVMICLLFRVILLNFEVLRLTKLIISDNKLVFPL